MDSQITEWVDKIFDCMTKFYGERWTKNFAQHKDSESLHKTMWTSGIIGLTQEQIRNALLLCKRAAESPSTKPPHVMEFYRYAKGSTLPFIDYRPINEKPTDPAIAKQYLGQIRKKLGSYNRPRIL